MRASYVAMPHQLVPRGWMVFNRERCHPVAATLTRGQAQILAAALNLAATGEERPYAGLGEGD